MNSFNCPNCGEKLTVNMAKKTVAFVIGHTSKDKGAVNVNGASEWDFWNSVYDEYLTDIGDVFLHNPNEGSYTKRQKEMAQKTKDYKVVFELHFNSSANSNSEGAEVLFYHTNATAKVKAERFLDKYCELTKIKNRGAKATNSGNGYGFLQSQKPLALLLEPFFGNNPKDLAKFDGDSFAKALKEIV
jgi:N-acetylmuramoyl-L-alanine amidase